MKAFDSEALELLRDLAVEGFPSLEDERCELLREYVDEIPEAVARGPLTIAVAGELIQVASNLVDLTGDLTEVGRSLLDVIEYGLECASDVHEIVEQLIAEIHRLAYLASHSNGAAETLMLLVREAISD